MSWQDSDTPYHHLFTMRTAENRWELCEPVSGQDVKQPLYRGMWLPQEFLPAPFEGYPGEKPNQLNPPRSNGSRLAAREFEVK
jgi:hypothetical protein